MHRRVQDGYFARILSVDNAGDMLDLDVAGLGRRHGVPAASVRPTGRARPGPVERQGENKAASEPRQLPPDEQLPPNPLPAHPVASVSPFGVASAAPGLSAQQHGCAEARALRALFERDDVLGPWLGLAGGAGTSRADAGDFTKEASSTSAAARLVDFVDRTFHAAAASDCSQGDHGSAATGSTDRGALVCGAAGMGKTSVLHAVSRALQAVSGEGGEVGGDGEGSEGGEFEGEGEPCRESTTRVWWIDGGLLLRSFSKLGCLAGASWSGEAAAARHPDIRAERLGFAADGTAALAIPPAIPSAPPAIPSAPPAPAPPCIPLTIALTWDRARRQRRLAKINPKPYTLNRTPYTLNPPDGNAALQNVQHVLWNFCTSVCSVASRTPRQKGGEVGEGGGGGGGTGAGGRRVEVLVIDDIDELFQARLRDALVWQKSPCKEPLQRALKEPLKVPCTHLAKSP